MNIDVEHFQCVFVDEAARRATVGAYTHPNGIATSSIGFDEVLKRWSVCFGHDFRVHQSEMVCPAVLAPTKNINRSIDSRRLVLGRFQFVTDRENINTFFFANESFFPK